METKVSLQNLSLDEIIKKFKALKNDETIISMSLCIKRSAPSLQSQDNKMELRKRKTQIAGQNNIEKLYELRAIKQNQSKRDTKPKNQEKKNENFDNKENIQNISYVKSFVSKYEANSKSNLSLIKDKRLSKAIKYYDTGNYDEAIRTFEQIYLELEERKLNIQNQCEEKQNQEIEGETQRNISNVSFYLGNCYFKKKNYQKAIIYYEIDFSEQSPKQKGLRKGNLATCFAYQKKNQQSLCHYKEALKILNEFQQIDLSNIYYNVGAIYLNEEMFDTSIKYLRLSVEQRKEKSPENQCMLYNTYFKLGSALRGENLIEEGLNNFFFALSLAQRGVNSSNNSINQVYKQIALCYEMLQKWNDAFVYYQKMLDKMEQKQGKGYIFKRVANIYYIGGNNLTEYQKYLRKAVDQYQKQGNSKAAEMLRSKCQ